VWNFFLIQSSDINIARTRDNMMNITGSESVYLLRRHRPRLKLQRHAVAVGGTMRLPVIMTKMLITFLEANIIHSCIMDRYRPRPIATKYKTTLQEEFS